MSSGQKLRQNDSRQLLVAAAAAFCVYFCMYAFRKPFAAGTFTGEEFGNTDLKTALIISQLAGYMLSKFIGIKLVAEMPARFRAIAILGLILIAELALVGFALAPRPAKVGFLFLNGLPLGMVFGLVLAYLEGRRQTEALSAVLCASFIISSGAVKSVGRALIEWYGIGEYTMPMVVGLLFLPPLFISLWLLARTPPPDSIDILRRSSRQTMKAADRRRFLAAYWPGLVLLVFVYVSLTVVRTIRDDFAVEIWRDMGVVQTPSIYATSELVVAVCVTALLGMTIWIRHNVRAIRITIGLMAAAFALVGMAVWAQPRGLGSPFAFMVACGVGLYVPYVAFHTTVFERLVAASRHPGNLGFLMYIADATGYLGYGCVVVAREFGGPLFDVLLKLDRFDVVSGHDETLLILPFFRGALLIVATTSVAALGVAALYFQFTLGSEQPLSGEEPEGSEHDRLSMERVS